MECGGGERRLFSLGSWLTATKQELICVGDVSASGPAEVSEFGGGPEESDGRIQMAS